MLSTIMSDRLANGHFRKGSKGGPGHPLSGKLWEMRKAVAEAITPEDIATVIKKMIGLAKGGNCKAAQLVLDRACGKVVDLDTLARLETLEKLAGVDIVLKWAEDNASPSA